jgi:hypothetical protein
VVFHTDDKANEISASSVKIEITDAKTGVTYTRELPIDYYETAYCLRLTGEGLDGKSGLAGVLHRRGAGQTEGISPAAEPITTAAATLRYAQIRFLPIYLFNCNSLFF